MATYLTINTPTYTLNYTTTSGSLSLLPIDIAQADVEFYNAGTGPVFIVTSGTAPVTAVFPTGTAPLTGTVIPPGTVRQYLKSATDGVINAIGTGGGALYISPGNV